MERCLQIPGFRMQTKNGTILSLIHISSIERGLNRDWIHGDKVIAEVEMSYSQFAEAITSMNIGTGVPVTVQWTEKDGKIPPCDFVSKREQFEDEFKTQRKNATRVSEELIQEVTELFNQKGTLKKADKEDIPVSYTHLAFYLRKIGGM